MNIKLDLLPFQEMLHADMCGPASLKIVLNYYGVEKSEQELAYLCNLVPGLGVDDVSIKKAAESLGLRLRLRTKVVLKILNLGLKKEFQ